MADPSAKLPDPPAAAHPPRGDGGIISGEMIAWLLVQLLALLLCAARVPLWARAPREMEQLALAVMLMTQTGAAAFIFPYLRSWPASLVAMAVAWPLAELAGFMSDTPPAVAASAEAFVSVWLLGLIVWRTVLRSESGKAYLAAIAAMWTLGGPILIYLRAEFRPSADWFDWSVAAKFGPAMGALAQIHGELPGKSWLIIAAVPLAAIAMKILTRRQFINTLSTR